MPLFIVAFFFSLLDHSLYSFMISLDPRSHPGLISCDSEVLHDESCVLKSGLVKFKKNVRLRRREGRQRAVTAAAALRNWQNSLKRQRVWAPPYLWGHKSRSQPAFQEHIKIFSSPRTFSMCFCSWSF